jgi:GH18 family chitinase
MAKEYTTSWQNPGDGARVAEVAKLPIANFNRYSWTVGFWFRPTSSQTVAYQTLFQIYIDSDNYWMMGSHITGIPYFNTCSEGTPATTYSASDPVLVVNNWYYLCAFGNESKFGMTINGILTTNGMQDYALPRGTMPDYLYLGSNVAGEDHANGNYSDFIILPYKTTAEQVYGYFGLYRPYYNLPRVEISGDLVNKPQTAPLICDGKIRQTNITEHGMKQYYQIGFELTETPGLLAILTEAQKKQIEDEDAGQKEYVVIGYFQGTPAASGVNANKVTHLFYAFADVYPGTSDIWFDSTKGQYASHVQAMVALKNTTNPRLKAILSVGGWDCGGYGGGVGASGFEIAMSSAAHRANFAANCAYLVDAYNLDGIDIDCEYPAVADKSNFTALILAVRSALGYSKFLSITTPGGSWVTSNFDLASLAAIVDYIGVMCYDLDQTGTKHHSNLYVSGLSGADSCNTAITTHLSYVPAAQLIMGVPFYGYTGLYATHTYDYFVSFLVNKGGYVRYWDDTAKVPYLTYGALGFKASYDDTISLQLKTKYIKDNNLGGAMIWNLKQNANEELITAIFNTLR